MGKRGLGCSEGLTRSGCSRFDVEIEQFTKARPETLGERFQMENVYILIMGAEASL
jgi:hypothetical protein